MLSWAKCSNTPAGLKKFYSMYKSPEDFNAHYMACGGQHMQDGGDTGLPNVFPQTQTANEFFSPGFYNSTVKQPGSFEYGGGYLPQAQLGKVIKGLKTLDNEAELLKLAKKVKAGKASAQEAATVMAHTLQPRIPKINKADVAAEAYIANKIDPMNRYVNMPNMKAIGMGAGALGVAGATTGAAYNMIPQGIVPYAPPAYTPPVQYSAPTPSLLPPVYSQGFYQDGGNPGEVFHAAAPFPKNGREAYGRPTYGSKWIAEDGGQASVAPMDQVNKGSNANPNAVNKFLQKLRSGATAAVDAEMMANMQSHTMSDGSRMAGPPMGTAAFGGNPTFNQEFPADSWNMPYQAKSGGWIKGAVNPAHKGYCTPMSKATCTPRRKAFARRAKAHFMQSGGQSYAGMSAEDWNAYIRGTEAGQAELAASGLDVDSFLDAYPDGNTYDQELAAVAQHKAEVYGNQDDEVQAASPEEDDANYTAYGRYGYQMGVGGFSDGFYGGDDPNTDYAAMNPDAANRVSMYGDAKNNIQNDVIGSGQNMFSAWSDLNKTVKNDKAQAAAFAHQQELNSNIPLGQQLVDEGNTTATWDKLIANSSNPNQGMRRNGGIYAQDGLSMPAPVATYASATPTYQEPVAQGVDPSLFTGVPAINPGITDTGTTSDSGQGYNWSDSNAVAKPYIPAVIKKKKGTPSTGYTGFDELRDKFKEKPSVATAVALQSALEKEFPEGFTNVQKKDWGLRELHRDASDFIDNKKGQALQENKDKYVAYLKRMETFLIKKMDNVKFPSELKAIQTAANKVATERAAISLGEKEVPSSYLGMKAPAQTQAPAPSPASGSGQIKGYTTGEFGEAVPVYARGGSYLPKAQFGKPPVYATQQEQFDAANAGVNFSPYRNPSVAVNNPPMVMQAAPDPSVPASMNNNAGNYYGNWQEPIPTGGINMPNIPVPPSSKESSNKIKKDVEVAQANAKGQGAKTSVVTGNTPATTTTPPANTYDQAKIDAMQKQIDDLTKSQSSTSSTTTTNTGSNNGTGYGYGYMYPYKVKNRIKYGKNSTFNYNGVPGTSQGPNMPAAGSNMSQYEAMKKYYADNNLDFKYKQKNGLLGRALGLPPSKIKFHLKSMKNNGSNSPNSNTPPTPSTSTIPPGPINYYGRNTGNPSDDANYTEHQKAVMANNAKELKPNYVPDESLFGNEAIGVNTGMAPYAYGGYMQGGGNNPFGTGMDYGIPSGPTFQESDIPSINWKHKEKRMGNPYAKQIAAGVIGTENFLTNLMPNLNGETKDANDKLRDSFMASNIYSTNTNSLKGAWSPEGYFQANRQDNGWMGNTFPGRALGGDYNPNEEYDLTPEEIVEIYRRGGTVKFC